MLLSIVTLSDCLSKGNMKLKPARRLQINLQLLRFGINKSICLKSHYATTQFSSILTATAADKQTQTASKGEVKVGVCLCGCESGGERLNLAIKGLRSLVLQYQIQRPMHIEGSVKLPQQQIRQEVMSQFTKFIVSWRDAITGDLKYVQAARTAIQNTSHHVLFVFRDLVNYNQQLANLIFDEYYKYEPVLNEALTQFMREQEKEVINEDQRPEESRENYECSWDDGYSDGIDQSVRGLKCNSLGKLIRLRGTVTRTSQVRPELKVGVFKCRTCGKTSKEIVQQFKYTEPKKCLTENCDRNSWELEMGKCTFADFQKLRVQEDPTKIPPGAMPRSIDVILRNQFTEKGQPGDICEIIGYLCVLPEISSMLKPGERTQLTTRSNETRGIAHSEGGIAGIKGMRDLSYKLIFVAINIKVENNQFDEFEPEEEEEEKERDRDAIKEEFDEKKIWDKISSRLTQYDMNQIESIKDNARKYEDMAESLFPTIYGHIEIKKALLLQLISGIHKRTQNKINIRGDINILIVGDPSSAKSQFLKCVNKFVPRSVYTNGKTTSAAGLTASVTRDENGNVGIEAGALMLADNGICCIDEFDKMELKDQVAIHEAMEQQTISIAKAGVYATLNARTSILAAANPIFGRYDKSKSLKNNINLSAPIMSRFDLFFVVCDEANPQADEHLSNFIINMHRLKDTAVAPKYDMKTLKKYISIARKIKPQLTHESAQLLRRYYIEIRSRDKNNNNSYRVTVRQLESMIRLSEAYARLELSLQIEPKHVKEAHRLLSCSILKLEKPEVNLEDENLVEDMQKMSLREEIWGENKRKREEEKKAKNLVISHELYQQVQRNILKIFKQKEKLHKDTEIDDEHQLSQQDLSTYLLSVNFQNGLISTTDESENMRKVINAIIKKMIKQERMLLVVEDSNDYSKKMLQIHPNYVEQ